MGSTSQTGNGQQESESLLTEKKGKRKLILLSSSAFVMIIWDLLRIIGDIAKKRLNLKFFLPSDLQYLFMYEFALKWSRV